MTFKIETLGIGYPYGIISDVHLHNWSAYSSTTSRGLNSRLQEILNEVSRAATTVLETGGKDLIITGDLFHTRGVIKPSVFNPTLELFKKLTEMGLRIHTFDGNHDMEAKVVDEMQSSLYGLAALDGFNVFYGPTVVDNKFLFVPYTENYQEVLELATKGTKLFSNLTLFCHVGMSGVLPGNLGHTLHPADFDALDLKYVFSGHFHNHVSFNSRIYSVGALTHQTWGDVGSLAGFVIVTEDEVKHYETKAPKFVDLNEGVFLSKRIKGNYIRIKDVELTEQNAELLHKEMKEAGALAVLDESTRPNIKQKDHAKEVKVDLGLNTALETFCKHTYGEKWKEVFDACLKLKS